MNQFSMVLLSILLSVSGGWAGEALRDGLGDPLPAGAVHRLGTTRMRFDRIGGFCYLPDGRAVVVAGPRIEVWDLAKGECSLAGEIPGAKLLAPVGAETGRVVAVADASNSVIVVWDLTAQKELRRWPTGQSNLVWLCLSPDGQRALTTGRIPPTLKEWNLADGKFRVNIVGQIDAFSMAIYGPGGNTAIVGDYAKDNILHYDLVSGKQLRCWSVDIYTSQLALADDEKRLLVGSRNYASEWNLADYTQLNEFTGHAGHEATSVAYGKDPDQVFTGARDGSIRRWNRLEAKVLTRWVPHPKYVTAMQVSPDGQWLLSYGGGLLLESDLQTGRPRLPWERHLSPVQGAVFAPTGRVVSAAVDGSMRVWDAASGRCLSATNVPGSIGSYAVAVSPDGGRIAVTGYTNVCEWTGSNPRILCSWHTLSEFERALVYTPDGRLISAGDAGRILLWAGDRNETVAELKGDLNGVLGHRGGILSLAVSPDGQRLLSGGRDGTVRLWDLKSKTLLQTLRGHRGWVEAVRFQGNGNQALSAGRDGRVLRWDLQQKKITGEMVHGSWLHALACAPGGKIAFSAGEGGTIMAWDLRQGRKLREFAGHTGAVRTLAVSENEQWLVSGADDTTLLVWNISDLDGRIE